LAAGRAAGLAAVARGGFAGLAAAVGCFAVPAAFVVLVFVMAVFSVPPLAVARRGFGASSDALGVRAMAASSRSIVHVT
jgi:hypothetical protein